MADRICCRCQSCRVGGLSGPAILITLGVLFLVGQLQGNYGFFSKTWPVLLLVIGAIKLGEALASKEGHVSR